MYGDNALSPNTMFQLLVVLSALFSVCFVANAVSEFSGDRPGPCFSFNDIMAVLQSDKFRNMSSVRQLMEMYDLNARLCQKNRSHLGKQKLFFALEGSRIMSRSIVALKISKVIGGTTLFNPPEGFSKLRALFNDSAILRRAFHALCLYATANNAIQIFHERHVIAAGYWLNQAAFAMVKKYYPSHPPQDPSMWKWPVDLLKPDLMFYIRDTGETSSSPTNEINYLTEQIYRRWKDPPVIFVTNATTPYFMTQQILRHLKPYLDFEYKEIPRGSRKPSFKGTTFY